LTSADEILGVDRDLVEGFLILFRDNYREVDFATIFLEQSEGISNGQSFLNVRDAMSHLVTALDPSTPKKKKADQLPTCEEHLRRAILEPYETTLNARLNKLTQLIDNYKQTVIPVAQLYPELRDSPNEVQIEAVRQEIHQLVKEGRAAKRKNLWNNEWREGVKAFAIAYKQSRDLYTNLERYHDRFRVIQRREEENRRQKRDRLIGIVGVIIGVLGVLVAILGWIR
jgi:flagellar biosynthesis GTPase FlhF